jgi:uncharacterized protein YkwD
VVRQRKLIWISAIALGALAAAVPGTTRADAGSPVPSCPPIPAVPGVTPPCDQGSQPQPAQTSVQGTESTKKTTKQVSVSATPEVARLLLAEVNRTRRAHGLRGLRYSARLTDAATAHARALAVAGEFTHAWPTTGRLFSSWIRNFYPARGYRTWSVGENLLWASPGFAPADAVQQWLDSPIHRRVMLTPSWRELGIGVVSAVGAPGAYGDRDVQIAAAEFGRRKA